MKTTHNILLSILLLTLFIACDEDENMSLEASGAFVVEFDNYVGTQQMQLDPAGSTDYRYANASGQEFNLSTFRYYVSNIKLEGPDGERFEDVMNVSANADDVEGYYLVLESDASSQFITLNDVPTGAYDKITFILGIAEEGVQEGAAGGILDPAEDAWFWNWNAGYINLGIEGTAADSPQERIEGDGWLVEENTFGLHVGGWKEVEPDDNYVNNIRTVTLDLGAAVTVSEDMKPQVHIVFDLLKILDGAAIDFSQTYSVHSPLLGAPLADQIPAAFTVDHVHQ
ncbi:hypothetical protein OKW21_004228 [Catalinimonas alkaloidigena]|uniref:MbnP family protein n=1 Tax=Catalinimonas alkaloidigena TaxID=1075417 RepID=UPI00240535E9|nr:MbnP family protein [Catalinimonas alkaloidigena]MDF9798965.1 hypothetical protein [Catalinimonas alkaloidigena]